MPRITVMLGGKVVRKHDFDQDVIIIGRHERADVFIDNPAISRQHARLYYQDGAYVLEDLGSTNGVFLNGRRIKAHFVSDGDEIQISKFTLKYELGLPRRDKSARTYMPELPEGTQPELPGEPTVYVPPDGIRKQHESLRSALRPHIVALSDGQRQRYPLDKRITVFGKDHADIPVKGMFAGGRVAEIVYGPQGFVLRAVGVIPAVRLNGDRVRESTLKNDDLIQIGDLQFTFKDGT
jgi:pSer/pThr/pTyr-binding forkhead associated (FHA) protein